MSALRPLPLEYDATNRWQHLAVEVHSAKAVAIDSLQHTLEIAHTRARERERAREGVCVGREEKIEGERKRGKGEQETERESTACWTKREKSPKRGSSINISRRRSVSKRFREATRVRLASLNRLI